MSTASSFRRLATSSRSFAAPSRPPCSKNWASRLRSVCPSPTLRELLTTLDAQLPVANLVVGLQEYGITNPSLIAGLEARGAESVRVRVYDWELPEDVGPLEENVRRIVAGQVDVAMFTSARQVLNLLKVADDLGFADDLLMRACDRSSWH